MSQIESFENNGLNFTVIKPYFVQMQTKTVDAEIVLQRLFRRENIIFNRIVMAIKTNDSTQSTMLASELIKIRILKRNLCVTLELMYHYNISYSQ
ncbi:hypothetical protein [Nitrosarchaeum sp. AC2]|uniref:hypothetical protein n=1 Tax=Nitrosarchaeum sp. AC2 TaxID=2259673 RepID=UPI0015CC1EA9|nr:hypothetical protein [Nitrosarchaeum sp. AC2]QLH10480.1 hypothetical protein DSQ20_02415 [Nitrosarchaeum sp. AC2]